MPFEPSAGTLAEWETYVSALKELNAGLLRAGVQDGVWSPRARPFREAGGRLLTDIPYPERLKVVRASWAKALNETERAEVGEKALTGVIRLKDVRLSYPSLQPAPSFTKEQLNYASKAAIDTFLKYDPKLYFATMHPDLIRSLLGQSPSRRPFWMGGDWATNATDRTVYQSYFGDTKISGLKADMIILDDPINTKGKKVKTAKPKPKTYNTVGVRFLRGHNLAKVYTYKVPKKTKLQLGEEIVVPSTFDGLTTNGIGVVVELHKEPQDTTYGIDYKFVTGRIAKIAQ